MRGHIVYTVKSGDNLSTIVDKFKKNELFPDRFFVVDDELTWEMVWADHENLQLRKGKRGKGDINIGDTVYLPYLGADIQVTIPNEGAAHASFLTGDVIRVTPSSIRPLVDAHMHIQSLHATPMTLQWATSFRSIFSMAGKIPADLAAEVIGKERKNVTKVSGFLNLGKIGRLSTDLVAKVYMNAAKNGDMKKSLFWMLWSEEKIAQFEQKKRDMREVAGKKLGLEELCVERNELLEDFYQMTAYYHSSLESIDLSIVMPMDLSYAHFWGAHGLPINLPVPGGNTFYYINDFVHLMAGRDWGRTVKHHLLNTLITMGAFFTRIPFPTKPARDIRDILPIKSVHIKEFNQPINDTDNNTRHLSYNFDFQQELENYLYYMGYRYAHPDYKEEELEGKPFIVTFGHKELTDKLDAAKDRALLEVAQLENELYQKRFRCQTEQEIDLLEDEYTNKLKKAKIEIKNILTETEEKYKEELTGKQYKHYLTIVPGDRTEMFEDYWLQRAYTEVSAFRYPLRMIPFYHYEPRRYYCDGTDLTAFAAEIKKRHGYYRLAYGDEKLKGAYPESKERADLELAEPQGLDGDYYLEMFSDRYEKKRKKGEARKVYHGSMENNIIPKSKLYPEGCFMGVKMYPALGYPGDLYDRSRHVHAEGDYYDEQFNNLEEIYLHCIEHNLPITSHCSPLGMSIADGFNYELCADLKKGAPPRALHHVIESALHVDDTCGHPRNWKRVLDKHSELKLCLAHFSGMGAWNGEGAAKGMPNWREDISDLIKERPNVYTDISCYTMDFGKLPDFIFAYNWDKTVTKNLSSEEIRELDRYYEKNNYGYYGVPYYELKAYGKKERSMARVLLRKAGYIDEENRVGLINDSITRIGLGLCEFIDANSKLKERILMGSDWYMAEMAITGVGPYYARMFELLKLVTKKLDKGYDVWHQFSVINPLNFLGMLQCDGSGALKKEKYNGKEIYLVDIDRVEVMLENLRMLSTDKTWIKESEVKPNEIDNFKKNTIERLTLLKCCRIFTAEEMKGDGELMILQG